MVAIFKALSFTLLICSLEAKREAKLSYLVLRGHDQTGATGMLWWQPEKEQPGTKQPKPSKYSTHHVLRAIHHYHGVLLVCSLQPSKWPEW